MTSGSRALMPLAHRLVWLRVALSDRAGPDVAVRFRRRMVDYLAGTGIAPVTSAKQIALMGLAHSITPYDVSMVVAWLVEQPEVVLVRRERAPVSSKKSAAGRRAHG